MTKIRIFFLLRQ